MFEVLYSRMLRTSLAQARLAQTNGYKRGVGPFGRVRCVSGRVSTGITLATLVLLSSYVTEVSKAVKFPSIRCCKRAYCRSLSFSRETVCNNMMCYLKDQQPDASRYTKKESVLAVHLILG